MGKRSVSKSVVVWCLWWLVIINLSRECDADVETGSRRALQDEPKGIHRHRLQLLLPLLIRISSRLATLVPTAMMALMGIVVFVVFSKKAFILSLFALLVSLADKFKKNEEVYIHKINTYPEYNDEEEHIHYHHGWSNYNKHHRNDDYQYIRTTVPPLPQIPHLIPLNGGYVRPFKPISVVNMTRRADVKMKKRPAMFPLFEDDNGNLFFRKG